MRKIISFFAFVAIVLTFAACGGDVIDPFEGKPFYIAVKNITDNDATIQIVAADKNATYFWTLEWADELDLYGSIEEFIEGQRYNYKNGKRTGDMELALSSDESPFPDPLDPYTNYVVIVFNLDEENKPILESIVSKPFTTDIDNRAFSVGEGKYVYFSDGNLQYNRNTNKWYFAPTQWDIIGKIHKFDTQIQDLFSQDDIAASADFTDFSTYKNLDGDLHTWRILSNDEWDYLIRQREQFWGLGTIKFENNEVVYGLILVPDKWKTPVSVSFTPTINTDWMFNDANVFMRYENKVLDVGGGYGHNIYTFNDWKKMQNNGAIFLPAAGYAKSEADANVTSPNWQGSYMTSTLLPPAAFSGYILDFDNWALQTKTLMKSYWYVSVRLVRDVK